MIEIKADLNLREKIAHIDGWTELVRLSKYGLLAGKHPEKNKESVDYFEVPAYEISFDAIAEVCDRHDVNPDVLFNGDCYEARFEFVDLNGIPCKGVRGGTRAIAMCSLLVELIKSRVAEQAKKKSEIEAQQKSKDCQESLAWYKSFCDRHGVLLERSTLGGHIEDTKVNMIYIDKNTGIVAGGETDEIAICNLLSAVLESRLTKENFRTGLDSEDVATDRVSAVTPFMRDVLRDIKERVNEQLVFASDKSWVEAYLDVARAANRLDAILIQKETRGLRFDKIEDGAIL